MKERPEVGDVVQVKDSAGSQFSGAQGAVQQVRTRKDGYWLAAELQIDDQLRWFTKGELDCVVQRKKRIGAPQGDFLRIERRANKRRNDADFHIYIGRALLSRWQHGAGDVSRVNIETDGEAVVLRAAEDGAYALDDRPGRQPRIHCDRARSVVQLDDGRYAAEVDGSVLTVLDPLPTPLEAEPVEYNQPGNQRGTRRIDIRDLRSLS